MYRFKGFVQPDGRENSSTAVIQMGTENLISVPVDPDFTEEKTRNRTSLCWKSAAGGRISLRVSQSVPESSEPGILTIMDCRFVAIRRDSTDRVVNSKLSGWVPATCNSQIMYNRSQCFRSCHCRAMSFLGSVMTSDRWLRSVCSSTREHQGNTDPAGSDAGRAGNRCQSRRPQNLAKLCGPFRLAPTVWELTLFRNLSN